MTLLTMVQDLCNYAPVSAPATVIGNTDPNAVRALAALQKAGEILAAYKGGGWSIKFREFVFSTVAVSTTGNTTDGSPVVTGIPTTAGLTQQIFGVSGNGVPGNTLIKTVDSLTQVTLTNPIATGAGGTGVALNFGQYAYALPADFKRIITDTEWDRGRRWPLIGPRSPQQWQLYKSGLIGVATFQRRWRIKPLVVNGILANYFCLDPVPFDNGTQLVFEYLSNAWCQSASGALQTRWLADTDTGLLDEDIIKLEGMWRFLRRLGLRYDDEQQDAFAETAKAFAVDGGMPVLDLAPMYKTTLIGPYNVPDTGFGTTSNG